MLQRAMADTGIHKSRTVMIGDTTYDIEMARAAGSHAVGVTWGYHARAELDEAGAHLIVDTYEALPGALAQLLDKDTRS